MTTDPRRRAEAFLETNPEETPTVSTTDARELVRELLAHHTERERQNDALRDAVVRYRALFEQAADAIVVFDAQDLTMREFNDEACNRLGYTRDEFGRLSIADIEALESRAEILQHVRKVVHDGAAVFETKQRTKAGAVLDIEVRVKAVQVNGRHLILGIWRDITDRKRSEKRLKQLNIQLEDRVRRRTAELIESETKYRSLVESTFDITCRMDADGVLRYVGPQASHYGFDPENLVGRHFLEVVYPSDRERIAADFAKTLADGAVFPSEFRIQRPDGIIHWFEELSTIQYDAEGAITGLTTVLRDVTKRRAAETREQTVLQRLQAFESAVNQGPGVVFRWSIAPGEWPVEMVTANVKQFGYEAEDLTSGRVSWPGITHPEDVPRLESDVRDFLEKGIRQFHQKYRLIAGSGEVRHVEDWNTVITDANGQPTHIQAIVMDVTHHREEEQRRRESEERYRRLFEAESDAILVLDPKTRRFVDVNPAALRLYGYTRGEFLKLTQWDITAEPRASDESIKQTLAGARDSIPLRLHRKKDGTVFPVEISVSMFTVDGRTVLCGLARDITERKKTEAERETLARQRQLALDAARLGWWHYDPQTKIATYDERYTEIFGVTGHERPNEEILKLLHPDDLPGVWAEVEAALDPHDPKPYATEYRVNRLDGTMRWVSAHGIAVFEGKGDSRRATSFVGTVEDITARKRSERLRTKQQAQLRHLAAKLTSAQDDEQRRIAQGLHDDVAQLLTACSFKLAVADRARNPAEAHSVHDEIANLLKEAAQKVRLLSFELSSSMLHRLGLKDAIHELCGSMSARYGVHFEFECDGSPEPLDEAVATVLFKAVRELLFNVVKHAHVKTATVTISADAKGLKLRVEDHGTGFPQLPEDEDVEVDSGLGLFGIKERLRDLGGSMRIESDSGVRTVVTLSVPIAEGKVLRQGPDGEDTSKVCDHGGNGQH